MNTRPHEHSFQRWSSPAIPDAAPTERADTMAAHHPPTFKVYTPADVRSVPFRKSMPAYEELRDQDDGIGARTLLKWTGIGIVAGLAVLAALIVVLNFGGDRAFASIHVRSALLGEPATPAAKPAVAPRIAEATPPTKLELPATKPAKVAPKPAAKKH